ncbi:MAG: hypothetical protein DMG12_13695 [Acidobacteria bacterium]|nr:MAG: hypothetical protein DMG12_13695 [Acidobacteriota bacterium]
MFELLTHHQFWTAVAGYWIFSAAIGSMPEPASNNGAGYLWIYRFLHTLAGNVTTAFGSRIPGLKALALVWVIPLLMAAPACAAHYTIHPGSLNKTDSAGYDALLVAQAMIDEARTHTETAPLPGGAKDALNTLIQSYNVARDSWLTYRGAVATHTPADIYVGRLSQNLSDLSNAIHAFKEAQ